jgi:hypothetical protein
MAGFPQRNLLTGSQVWTGNPAEDAQTSQDGFDSLALLLNQLKNRVIALTAALAAGLAAISSKVIFGVTDGSNATTGYLGEYFEASAASGTVVGWATATPQNVLTILLSPGDWDVAGIIFFSNTSATPATRISAGLNLNPATLPAVEAGRGQLTSIVLNPLGASVSSASIRISINTPQTVYLVGQADYPAGTMTAGGYMNARRVR